MVITPIEASVEHFPLRLGAEEVATTHLRLDWVVKHWQVAVKLVGSHADFKLAMEAYELATFIPSEALTLVSLWGALEALFSPSSAELRFRVSALIASYLCKPGQARLEKQKEIFDLYDKRSAAAHGKPRHTDEHLLQSFAILRSVLIRMMEDKHVPTKVELGNMLMGVK